MPTEKLTDKRVATVKAPAGERLELWDELTSGLCLRVSENKKVWICRYRTDDDRQRRLTLGEYSGTHGLKWARGEVEELRVRVRKGEDPAGDRQRQKAVARSEPIKTFNDLIDAYLVACERGHYRPKRKQKREGTLEGERAVLARNVRPALGAMRIEDIAKSNVRKLLNDMLDRGIGAQTNKTHALIRQVFNYGIFSERCETNPAALIAKPASDRPRERVLTDDELKVLWGTMQRWPNDLRLPGKGRMPGKRVYAKRGTRIAVQLAMILLVRRREVAGMRRSELDLDQATWTIPAGRGKSSRTEIVPLPPHAVSLIREALVLSAAAPGGPGDPGFPSPRSRDKPMGEGAVTHLMHLVVAALGLRQLSPHDLRRTGATAMASERLGIMPIVISRVLGQANDTSGAAAVTLVHYALHSYMPEKRRALSAWEKLLLEIVGERSLTPSDLPDRPGLGRGPAAGRPARGLQPARTARRLTTLNSRR